eukprot:540108-Pyramimonas_sp.AAC.1
MPMQPLPTDCRAAPSNVNHRGAEGHSRASIEERPMKARHKKMSATMPVPQTIQSSRSSRYDAVRNRDAAQWRGHDSISSLRIHSHLSRT